MAHLTCVVDAKCLIDHVQGIKDLLYSGEISLHIPTCTFENVEKAYQSSLLQKESQKEPLPKKSTNKASGRKEQQPLFDLNPRIAREFLLRSQSKTDQTVNDVVTFQLPGQQFTQWKNEEEKAIKAEQPPEQPPSSFAQALLRKLNIVEEDSGPKAPAKPRLVAKDAAINKTPWKYHKVPNVPSAGLPSALKPLLSCMLWRLHEYENNPLKPQSFVLATDDKETISIAKKLNIPLQDIKQIQAQVAEKLRLQDTRNKVGQMEVEFGVKVQSKAGSPTVPVLIPKNETPPIKAEPTLATVDVPVIDSGGDQAQPTDTVKPSSPATAEDLESLPVTVESPVNISKQIISLEPMITAQTSGPSVNNEETVGKPSAPAANATITTTTSLTTSDTLSRVANAEIVKPPSPQPSPVRKAAQVAEAIEPASEDEDSDVDIIVFKPKSRPGSSYIKKAPEATKTSPLKSYTEAVTQHVAQGQPRPQIEQPTQATTIKYETLPSLLASSKQPITVRESTVEEATPVVPAHKPSVPLTYTAALEMGLPKKVPVKAHPITPINGIHEAKSTPAELPVPQSSHLAVSSPRSRPQTPKGGHVQGQNGFRNQPRQPHIRSHTPRDTANPSVQHLDHRRSKKQSPPRILQPKVIHSRSPSDEPFQPAQVPGVIEAMIPPESSATAQPQFSGRSTSSDAGSDKGQHRSPSDGLSNPQKSGQSRSKRHPSYPRFNQVSAKAQRAAQYQPTTTPIVIDADSFDRSSYVKPQFHGIQAHNGNAHTMNGQTQFAGVNSNGRSVGGRGAIMGGRATPRSVDGDVDFVLKSGTPRGRGRGTGRLWVP